jgi:hypothetical protein
MKVLGPDPKIGADSRSVSFILSCRGESVTCLITREALEAYFWLAPNADDGRMLKVFSDGFSRIEATAQRKLLAHPSAQLELTAADFSKSR